MSPVGCCCGDDLTIAVSAFCRDGRIRFYGINQILQWASGPATYCLFCVETAAIISTDAINVSPMLAGYPVY